MEEVLADPEKEKNWTFLSSQTMVLILKMYRKTTINFSFKKKNTDK